MKKIIIIIGLIFIAFLGFSQNEGENININNAKLNNRLYGDKSGGIDTLIVPDTDSLGQYKYMNMLNPANDLDGVNRRTLSDTISKYAFVEPRDSILFNTSFVPILTQQGTIWWNGAEYTLNIETGLGPTIQVGQETLLLYYNDTGIDIPNFSVLHPKSAVFAGGIVVPTPDLASASTWELSEGTLSVATQLIPNGQLGFAVRFGRARDGNTSLWGAGSQLWLSTTPGEITDVKPIFPDYAISLGGSLNSELAPDGEIFVSITKSIEDTYNDAWDGSVRETFNFTTSSNGTVVTGILKNADDTRNLTLLFSDGFYTLDVTPADTIILTPGTDEATQTNYVYIPIATKVLTLSTSGYPTTEHCRIATLEVQSALNVQSVGGTRGNQNQNDHIKLEDDNGHILHVTAWIRRQFATWGDVGCEATFDATAGNGYVSTTAGKVSQLHLQDVTALSMPTVDIMIANDPDVVFVETDNLNTITKFSDGSAWNNKWGKIVVWLIANKTGEPDFLCVNLPRAGENSSTLAIDDESGFADYSIPTKYKSNAILVGAFSINVNSGVITYSADSQDLRGTIPSNIAGGVGAGGVSSFLALVDTDPSFTAFAFQRANAGATALENAQTTEDASGNITIAGWTLTDSLSVTNGATIGGDLDVTGAGTFGDDVTIATTNAALVTTGAGVMSIQLKNTANNETWAIENFRNGSLGDFEFNLQAVTKMYLNSSGDLFTTGMGTFDSIYSNNGVLVNGNLTSDNQFGTNSGDISFSVNKTNLTDTTTYADGFLVNDTDGTLNANASYTASDYIQIEYNKKYYQDHTQYAIYDVDTVYLSGDTGGGLIEMPSNAKFIRLSKLVSTNATLYKVYLFSSFGNSITAQNRWQPTVADELSLDTLLYGVGGSLVSGVLSTAMNQDTRIDSIYINSDIIAFLGGTNDWVESVPLGSASSSDITEFYGAINTTIQKLKDRFPDKMIVVLTTTYAEYPNKGGWTDQTGVLNNEGLSTNDYAEALEARASFHNIKCIRLDNLWDTNTITDWVVFDGAYIHPNEPGGELMAQRIIPELWNEIVNYELNEKARNTDLTNGIVRANFHSVLTGNLDATGDIDGATLSYNGTDINTNTALSNVAYTNKANTFSTSQVVTGLLTLNSNSFQQHLKITRNGIGVQIYPSSNSVFVAPISTQNEYYFHAMDLIVEDSGSNELFRVNRFTGSTTIAAGITIGTQAVLDAEVPDFGQVKALNISTFTNDADYIASVTTLVDNQVLIATGDGTAEGDVDLTFNGSVLTASGGFNTAALGAADGSLKITLNNGANGTIDFEDPFINSNKGSDPTPSNGMQYYSTATNTGRYYQNGGWFDMIGEYDILASSTNTTSSTLVDISGMSFSASANSTYGFEIVLFIDNTHTDGSKFGIDYSTSGASVQCMVVGQTSSSGTSTDNLEAFNTASTPAYLTSVSVGAVSLKGIFSTGANAGSFTAQYLDVNGSGTTTIKAKSYMKVYQIN